MSEPQIAVIDLGTNTFHLLVVRAIDGRLEQTYRERIFVNLAEDGIRRIGEGAWYRGARALEYYAAMLSELEIDQTIAVGTAALRTASNAADFIREMHLQTGLDIEVISGAREAGLIALGVREAIPHIDVPGLIMDIGGGSVEFILENGNETLFSQSYPAGVAVLYEEFHKSEPITTQQLEALDRHLERLFTDLLATLKQYPDCVLVGASGTFEVIDHVLHPMEEDTPYSTFSLEAFDGIYREIIGLDLSQRLEHPDIPQTRAKYIVVAVHLIAFVLRYLQGPDALISKYAMKEGLAAEWFSRFRLG